MFLGAISWKYERETGRDLAELVVDSLHLVLTLFVLLLIEGSTHHVSKREFPVPD